MGMRMVIIRLFGDLRYKIGSSSIEYRISGESRIEEVLKNIDLGDSSLYDHIIKDGQFKSDLRILVNGIDVRRLNGLDTKVRGGDTIFIGPPVAGGGMVDISSKPMIYREALAEGYIILKPYTISLIRNGAIEKGDVPESVKISSLNAVKNTPNMLPYCHPIKVTGVEVKTEILDDRVKISVLVKSVEQTGVEMEALTGVMAGLLTIWDMVKKHEKDEAGNYPDTRISDVRVVYKHKEVVGG